MLVSRFIDRSIRPLFADGYNDETQITATVLSSDPDHPADLCAFVGASAALSISEIPFLGPIAAVRIARVDGEYRINPGPEASEGNDLDLIVAGSQGSIVMVEGGANQLPESEVLDALRHAHREIQKIIARDRGLRRQGRQAEARRAPRRSTRRPSKRDIQKRAGDRLGEAFRSRTRRPAAPP